jgi:hypothetical protein
MFGSLHHHCFRFGDTLTKPFTGLKAGGAATDISFSGFHHAVDGYHPSFTGPYCPCLPLQTHTSDLLDSVATRSPYPNIGELPGAERAGLGGGILMTNIRVGFQGGHVCTYTHRLTLAQGLSFFSFVGS